jgi:citrate lyase subunit beta/citryl-CoA lyase
VLSVHLKIIDWIDYHMSIIRSALYVPGNHDERTLKVFRYSSDAIIFDLEDAVPLNEKEYARNLVEQRIINKPAGNHVICVRINSIDTQMSFMDIQSIVNQGLDCIVVPKVESVRDIHIVDWLIGQFETIRNLDFQYIKLIPIIETPKGIMNVNQIAKSSKRIKTLAFGQGDFTSQTGMVWDKSNPALITIRSQLVVASAAAGLEAPMDVVYPDINNVEGLKEDAKLGHMIGCQGKTCIHPKQIETINNIYTPNSKVVNQSKKIYEAFVNAERAGVASFTIDGQFVDYAIVEKAKKVLELAEILGVSDLENPIKSTDSSDNKED